MSRTQLFAIVSGVLLLILVLEMVRRRRLREEYSWLWLLTAIGYLFVAIWPGLAEWVSGAIGAARPASAFAFLGLLFLFLIAIQFSVQISRLSEHNKDLAQHIAVLDSELRRLTEHKGLPSGAASGETVAWSETGHSMEATGDSAGEVARSATGHSMEATGHSVGEKEAGDAERTDG